MSNSNSIGRSLKKQNGILCLIKEVHVIEQFPLKKSTYVTPFCNDYPVFFLISCHYNLYDNLCGEKIICLTEIFKNIVSSWFCIDFK